MRHQEKKFKVADLGIIKSKLEQLGAKPINSNKSTHYYVNQPGNNVLKLVVSSKSTEIHRLDEKDGRFQLVERIKLKDTEAGFKWLIDKGHINLDEISMTHKDYEYRQGIVGLYTINNSLYSVILDFPAGQHDIIAAELCIDKEEIISVPYNLYLQSIGKIKSVSLQSGSKLEITKLKINILLDEYFQSQILKAKAIDKEYGQLWQIIREVVYAGGKRTRPYLTVLGYEAYNEKSSENVYQVAAAIELLHQSLLIHDDIIDRDYVRHGKLNVAGHMKQKYSSLKSSGLHYANSSAIIAGDLLLSGSYQLIIESTISEPQKTKILTYLGEAINSVGAGQLMDMGSLLRSVEKSDIMKIASYKTASYSFILPFICGAEIGGANPEQLKILTLIGEKLGVAYQLRDDILGTFGDSKTTGKSLSSDIREGKHTYLMQQAYKLASPKQRALLYKSVGNPKLTKASVKQVRDILDKTGAKSSTEALIKKLSNQAAKLISKLDIDKNTEIALVELIHSTSVRNY